MKKLMLIFLILCFGKGYSGDKIVTNDELPTVAVITTGGTINEINDPLTGASVTDDSVDLIGTVPEIFKLANIKLYKFSNLDSSQMTPQIWAELSKKVEEILKDINIIGAVITHGTDTMAEGAYFLELTLKANKPVVFTGAMKNFSDPFSDGPSNLYNAILQVISDIKHNWGVTVTLNQYINAAKYVIKTNTINLPTFESSPKSYLGYIFDKQIIKMNDISQHTKFPIPEEFPKIFIYKEYAGSDPDIIRHMVELKADAIIVEGLGSGNVQSSIYEQLQFAMKQGIIVVITSVVPNGGVFPIYGDIGGGGILREAGALFSPFLRSDKTRLLLLLAIPYIGKHKQKLSDYLSKP